MPASRSPNRLCDEPTPDEVRLAPGLRVSYVWRDGRDVRLLVTQFPGDVGDPGLLKKLAGQETVVDRLELDGNPAVWLEGGPHVVLFVAPDGRISDDQGWLAGNTLLVDRNGTTIRVEGALDRRDAIELVRAMPRIPRPRDRGRKARGYPFGGQTPETRDDVPAEHNYKAYGGGEAAPRPSGDAGRARRRGPGRSLDQVVALEGADRVAGVLGDRHGASGREIDEDDRLRRRDHQRVVGEAHCHVLVGRARAAEAADPNEAFEQVVEAGRGVVLTSMRASRTPCP